MNGGSLDAKFSKTYDPRADSKASDSETDDWGIALRALRERQSHILSTAMTQRLHEMAQDQPAVSWPTYTTGEREWDRGKVILDDGTVGAKVWGVDKPL
jgi:hypothetical protein